MTATNFKLVVTDDDLELAREAMNEGFNNCKAMGAFYRTNDRCNCDMGSTVGCRARVEAVAKAIAVARKL